MRRGRGKGKKQNAREEDHGSGEEEKIPAYRRRGRPQKPIKDETEGEELVGKIEEGDEDGINSSLTSKDLKNEAVSENGRKRKRSLQCKENNADVAKEENGNGSKSSTDDSIKSSIGYRQIGSRRKNKPRRAAEAVVECNGV
ncbi:PREDICTED: uncharacterized protein LOC104802478 [Tarenaya hassleriana]|uniref:uncharacterized protein LOC104802478 n=1 Tax=Tarenaya hassleriana TaxID=28532 RepID=UPI00053C7A63|nr:PREDICTED: uncharacterized protein LOC104802478 [Tarenaya hassleriana]